MNIIGSLSIVWYILVSVACLRAKSLLREELRNDDPDYHHVIIEFYKNNEPTLCHGALLSPRIVISASSCLSGIEANVNYSATPTSGKKYVDETIRHRTRQVDKICHHPDDISILRLSNSVNLGDDVSLAKISRKQPESYSTIRLVGQLNLDCEGYCSNNYLDVMESKVLSCEQFQVNNHKLGDQSFFCINSYLFDPYIGHHSPCQDEAGVLAYQKDGKEFEFVGITTAIRTLDCSNSTSNENDFVALANLPKNLESIENLIASCLK